MKKFFAFVLLTFLVVANLSCKKTVETDSERLWNTIQSVIKSENIQRVLPTTSTYFDPSNTTIIGDYGTTYSFNAPMLTVGTSSYNLNTMTSYQVATVSSYKCLVLLFR